MSKKSKKKELDWNGKYDIEKTQMTVPVKPDRRKGEESMLKPCFPNKHITQVAQPACGNGKAGGFHKSSPVDTWQRFNPFTNMRKSKATDNINSEKTFRHILRRERARSDRNGHGFSLVTFQVDGFRQNQDCA